MFSKRMKHILMIDHSSAIGGAELSLEALVTGMDAGLCRYTVALPGPGPLAEQLRSGGVTVVFLPVESWRWWVDSWPHAGKFIPTLPWQAVSLSRWLRFLRQLQPDIIHFNINRLVEPVVAARILGIPSVVHFRDIPSRMSLADRWIANSHATECDIRLTPVARSVSSRMELIWRRLIRSP